MGSSKSNPGVSSCAPAVDEPSGAMPGSIDNSLMLYMMSVGQEPGVGDSEMCSFDGRSGGETALEPTALDAMPLETVEAPTAPPAPEPAEVAGEPGPGEAAPTAANAPPEPAQPSVTKSNGPLELTIVSYNIQAGCTAPMKDGVYNLTEEGAANGQKAAAKKGMPVSAEDALIKSQAEVLKSTGADVILLQEAGEGALGGQCSKRGGRAGTSGGLKG